ncbi:vacuolar membrane protein [Ephemerocybe angulata]|uniref:Vacuolar membrane protein n=1 Tax=Ephemerocybe angulata TaxID=980116 RepID=A0A8H6IG29_9AGAR|nr:vacuolar membrane protein [Tulosesus angulatus]
MSSTSSALTPSAAPAWRQFSFFDVVPVKDPHDLESSPYIFKIPGEISTMVSSSAGMLVADIHGSIHLLNREFESASSWVAHVGGRVTHMVERKGILVTLGEEDTVKSPLLKIWDIENRDKKTGTPNLLRSTKIQLNNRPHPVTTVALSETLSHLSIGLGDGTVVLYRHLDQSLAGSTSLTALPKSRVVHESPTEPVTGLGFREPTEESPNTYLFIVTTNRVLCYHAAGRGSGGTPTVVDEIGCGLGCATMDWRAKDMVVARDEALYLCTTEGRGACYAYEGHKSSVHAHLSYLVMVSPPFFPSAAAASATVRNFVARSTNPSETDITKVTVFDLENKLVAYSGAFKQGVRDVVSQWGNIYVLSTDGQLLSLEEKSTAAKLDMLYRKTLYGVALNLAKTQSLDEGSVADIRKQYGDHLYAKGDYDGAMAQYLKTIGYVQPSYVIRKFLDSQRIHNLVTYLQELHSLGVANSDHTTLLLNTYTKLKDVNRLDSFIKTESKRDSGDPDELPFDLDTAIRVCRQAGYFEHASYLAKKYDRHEEYLRIQIEDAGNVRDALAYLRKLGPEAAESNLARYGRAMLQALPEETTQLFVDLCTNTGQDLSSQTEASAADDKEKADAKQVQAPAPSYLSYLALNRGAAVPTVTSSSTETATAAPPSPSIKTIRAVEGEGRAPRRGESMYEPAGASTPPPSGTMRSAKAGSLQLQQREAAPPPLVKKLSPRIYFPHFADHMEQFVVFLETVAKRRWGQSVEDKVPGSVGIMGHTEQNGEHEELESLLFGEGRGVVRQEGYDAEREKEIDRQDQVAVWNTLLELYLTLPTAAGGAFDEGVMRDKALRVLRNDALPFDRTHALILCSTHAFTPGLVLLWEKMGMFEDVLRFWIDKHNNEISVYPNASQKVVDHLMQYGPEHPELYPLVLRFLTSTPELLGKHEEDVKGMVEYVDEEGIMEPLGVIQVLSRNGVASVGLIKEWLVKRIRESRAEIHNDEQLTKSYQLETASRRKLVEELSDPDQPRVFHNTRCAVCHAQLDLPTIHFMCSHSYHQRCVADHETECPICAQEHSVIREIRRNNERLADQHDVFLAEVKESGFEAIASAYSRGLLNNVGAQGRAEEGQVF